MFLLVAILYLNQLVTNLCFCRLLCDHKDPNFTDSKLKQMEETVVDFVVKLNTQRIKREFGAKDSVNEDCDDENKTITSAGAKACYKTGTSPYQDDYLDDLLEMDPDDAFADDKSNERTLSDAMNEFRTKIETELTQYTMYCATVD